MRILHLDCGREMRGGQWQALWLVEGLAAGGHQATLLAPPASPLLREALARGLDGRPLRLRELRALSRRCDLVHAHDARAHTIAAVLARSPLVVARRVAFPVHTGPLSRWKYSRAAHYLAVSRYVAGRLACAGVPQERITVVYDGVPPPEAPAGGPLVVAPRTGDPAKGSSLALQAASLAGVDLHFSNRMEADLPRARLLVYLTHQEGLGSAALLAMAHGVPVVASRVGGLPEIVEDGRTGLLVGNDPAAIAAAIRRLLEDEPERLAVAERGRRAVLEKFTVNHMIRATLSVYQRVLSCSKPS